MKTKFGPIIASSTNGYYYGIGRITVKNGEEESFFYGPKHHAESMQEAMDGIKNLVILKT